MTEERPCSLAFPSHAITENSEHHLAKAERCGTLSCKDSLVDPENCTKQLHDRVQLQYFNSEVTTCDQQELMTFQQYRYNWALPWQRWGAEQGQPALVPGRMNWKAQSLRACLGLLSGNLIKKKPLRSINCLWSATHTSLECMRSEGHSSGAWKGENSPALVAEGL